MTTSHVFLYCRISEDRQGRREGVEAQKKKGLAYAAERWPGVPVRVYCDNDLSAAKDDVHRPEFEKMREAIRRGECAHLWAVEQSRFTRIENVWFVFAADLIKAGISEVHTRREGVIDVQGVVSGIMAVLGAHEVRQLRKRVNDKLAERAHEGRPHGHAGFAYRHRVLTEQEQQRLDAWWMERERARQRGEDIRRWREDNPRPNAGAPVLDDQGRAAAEIIPERAELLRWAAERILDGWSLTNVARDLRKRGVRGAYGGQIMAKSVYQMLTNPAVAGYRQYRGEIIGKATWEAVLDDSTWRAVRAVLNERRYGRYGAPRRAARRYLLTQFAFCASCEQALNASWLKREQKSSYRCVPGEMDGKCGRMAIQVDETDRYVIKELFEYLEQQDIGAVQDENAETRDRLTLELQGLDAQRKEWTQARDVKALNLAEFLAAKAKFDEEQQRIERELADLPAPVVTVSAADLRADWPSMTLDEKRKVVEDWIEKIVVHPAPDKPTMRTVAERSGFGVHTVHKVFSGRGGRVLPSTAEHIRAAARDLGYQYQPAGTTAPVDTDRIKIHWR